MLTSLAQAQNVYVLNLGLSAQSQYYNKGAFKVYNSSDQGLAVSAAWLKYTGTGLPSGVADTVQAMGALAASDWQFVQSDSSQLSLNSGDYIIVRVFPADSSVSATSTLQLCAVFGRGSTTSDHSSLALQSPLAFSAGPARAVVVTDDSLPSSWSTPTGTDNAWTLCLGKIQNVGSTTNFVLNVGAKFSPSGGTNGTVYTYGHDPQMHVGAPPRR